MNISDLSKEQMEKLIETVTKRVSMRLDAEKEAGALQPVTSQPASESSSTCALSYGDPCGGCGECTERNATAVKEIIDAGAERVASKSPAGKVGNLAPFIDHTLLKPNATDDQVEKLCKEAMKYKFASVCVNSAYVPLASKLLQGSGVKVCTVVGFPLGAMSSESKACETREAISKGADEIDMVINVGKLKSGDYAYVCEDIKSVVRAAQGRCVKVILETSSLTDDEKVAGCILAKAAGADYVKTSTGFGSGGATVEDVALMRKTVGSKMGVKASGGIRSAESAREMIKAGATRIGASASVAIVQGG